MVIDMNDSKIRTVEQLQQFRQGHATKTPRSH